MASFGSIAAVLKRNKPSAAAPAENPARRFNTEDISVQLQRVLAPLQIENLSLHNALGELVWRNDGAFGDDEQAMVLDALDMFAIDEKREDLRLKLDDDRSALFAIARDASQVMRGLALVIVETPETDELAAKLSGPRLQAQMRRFAQLLAPLPVAPCAATPAPAPAMTLTAAAGGATISAAQDDASETLLVPRQPIDAEEFTVRPDMTVALSPAQTVDLLRGSEIKRGDPSPRFDASAMEVIELGGDDSTQPSMPLLENEPTLPDISTPEPALHETTLPDIALNVQPLIQSPIVVERRSRPAASADAPSSSIRARRYTRLRAGGAARRYEVKSSPSASFKGDLALTTMVAMHVQRSLERYSQTPSTFAVPLSAESVAQNGWLSKVQSMLTRTGLPQDMLGFSLSADIQRHQAVDAERFIAECEAVGCFIVLDDFSLQHSGLALLRSGAVKCLKLDARLIASVINDRFAHAQLVAIVQAARVLGQYCVAKQVTSNSQAKWLTSAGIEFADGVGRGVIIAAAKREPAEM